MQSMPDGLAPPAECRCCFSGGTSDYTRAQQAGLIANVLRASFFLKLFVLNYSFKYQDQAGYVSENYRMA
jgi:hypothetical protein